MAVINKDPSYVNREGFNSHDLSHQIDFSSSCGQILPINYDLLSPGEKVDLQFNMEVRTQPLDASANLELEFYIDTFFVPIEQIYKPFSSMVYGINDFDSDFFPIAGSQPAGYVPFIQYQDIVTWLKNSSNTQEFRFTATAFQPSWTEAIRLLDLLGFPCKNLFGGNAATYSPTLTNSMNILFLAAYQKIFSDFYRLEDRINNIPESYNYDSFFSTSQITDAQRIGKALTLHYVPYDRDYYMNTKVSPLFGPNSIDSFSGSANAQIVSMINNWLVGSTKNNPLGVPSSPDGVPIYSGTTPTSVGGTVGAGSAGNPQFLDVSKMVNTAQLRGIFATEKLMEIIRRTRKHYDAQTMAFFGIDVPTGISGECFFVGRHTQKLQIGDVVSTAETEIGSDVTPLGKIGGRGFSYDQSGHSRFTAPCHGVLMSVYYCLPKVKYSPIGIDRLTELVKAEDFYNPVFDGLGMQPLFLGNISYLDSGNAGQISGWQYRYMELKQKISKTHGNLASSMNYWSFQRKLTSLAGPSYFYCSPDVMNNLFLVQYNVNQQRPQDILIDNAYQQVFENDPLMNFCFVNYRKASKMSVFGLPRLTPNI